MKRWLKQESGLSLMELLATIVISAILVSFIMGIFIFMQKKSDSQKDEIKGLSDITVALKSITKDIRYAEKSKDIVAEEDYLEINKADGKTVIYKRDNNILMKNNTNYIYDVEMFNIENNNGTVTIQIESKSGKTIGTEIVLRGGDENSEEDE